MNFLQPPSLVSHRGLPHGGRCLLMTFSKNQPLCGKKKESECIIRYTRHIVQTYVQKAGTLVFPHAETIWAARPGILAAQ